MASVGLKGVSKSFGSTEVLRSVDLDVADGEFVTLLGPSGCGKSTLLRIIAGLERPDDGEVTIDGIPMADVEARDRGVAMVFQNYALYPHMTVRQNIALPLRMRRMSRIQRLFQRLGVDAKARHVAAEVDREVSQVASSLQIGHLLDRKPSQLSGGQRQRVALGRAIIRRPVAFLMDEPLSSLDSQLRVAMRSEISLLHRQLGTTFIFVTHDQSEAMTMSDRIAVMLDGGIRQIATPEAIYNDPSSLDVARFVGSPQINTIRGAIDTDGRLVHRGVALFHTPYGAAGDVVVAIRPEALVFLARGGMQAVVIDIERLGSERLIHVRLKDADVALTVRCPGDSGMSHEIGRTVRIAIEEDRVFLFGPDGLRIRSRRVVEELACA